MIASILELLFIVVGLPVGFFLPGWFLARRLNAGLAPVFAFIISTALLFHFIFWCGVLGLPVAVGSVGAVALLVTVALGVMHFKKPVPVDEAHAKRDRWTVHEWVLLSSVALVFLLLAVRSICQPLTGWDTPFRWEFLARQIMRHGRFDFYPPRSPEDFRHYFYVDAIPPLISFSYYWLYACIGSAAKAATALLVSAQALCIVVLSIGLGHALLDGKGSSLIAAAIAASSPLLFWAIFMGQETGWTALSLTATLYAVLKAPERGDVRSAILAGVAAGVGALSREYGWAFLICGGVLAMAQRWSWRSLFCFVMTGCLVAGPWYVRNWVLTGNPFYSHDLAGLFPVNAVHAGIMGAYKHGLGPSGASMADALKVLVMWAPLPMLFFIVSLPLLRRRGGSLAFAVLFVTGLWAYSVAKTAGGVLFSMRVLSPALVLASICGGIPLARLARRGTAWRWAVTIVLVMGVCWGGVVSSVVPANFFLVPRGEWGMHAFSQPIDVPARQAAYLEKLLPRGARVLTEDSFTHSRLADSHIQLVPVWSPEVAFLHTKEHDPERIREKLRDRGISYALFYPKSLNFIYFRRFPFYSRDLPSWKPIGGNRGFVVVQEPNLAPEQGTQK